MHLSPISRKHGGISAEFSDRVVLEGNDKILPMAAIYGANASGKSNIYNAFEYTADYVIESFKYGDEEEKFEEYRPTPFLFDSVSSDAETSFEVYFTIPGDRAEKTYNYGFCVDRYGVTEEWLNSKAKTARKFKPVFYRSAEENVKTSVTGFLQMSLPILGILLRISSCHAVCLKDLLRMPVFKKR